MQWQKPTQHQYTTISQRHTYCFSFFNPAFQGSWKCSGTNFSRSGPENISLNYSWLNVPFLTHFVFPTRRKLRERRDDSQRVALWSLFVEKESLSSRLLQVPRAIDLLGLPPSSRVCFIHWAARTQPLLMTLSEVFTLVYFIYFMISCHFISFLMIANAKPAPEYAGKMRIQFQGVFNILFGIS